MFGCFFGWGFQLGGRREAWNVGSIAFATVLGSCVVARMLVDCVIFNHERNDDDGALSLVIEEIIVPSSSSSLFHSFICYEI